MTVIGTLALGIGAAAALYSMVSGSLFPTMPFSRPAEDFRPPLSVPGGRIYLPYVVPAEVMNLQAYHPVYTVARLRPGSAITQAQAELRTLLPEKGGSLANFMQKFEAVICARAMRPSW